MQYLTVICSVCHLWRSTALNEPLLWTNIVYHDRVDFTKTDGTNGLPPRVVERIEAYLLRSKRSKLFIFLSFGSSRRGVGHMKAILRSHLGRCESLKLIFDSDQHFRRFLPLPVYRIPKLTCWARCGNVYKLIPNDELYNPKQQTSKNQQQASTLRTGGPSATRAVSGRVAAETLANPSSHARKPPVNRTIPGHINAAALTELHVSRVSWECAMKYLPQCQALRQLKLTCPCEGETLELPPFTLPYLIHLEAPTLDFSPVMHTPELRSLALRRGFEQEDELVPPPLPSWRKLHTLRLLSADPSRLDVIALLRANPTIKVLEIGWCATDHMELGEFDLLMWTGGSGIPTNKTNRAGRNDDAPGKAQKRGKKQTGEDAKKKRVEFSSTYNLFLPSLRYLKFDVLFYARAAPIDEAWASHWLESRPELRFDGDDRVICDGTKVDKKEMDLIINEYPKEGGRWCTFV